MQKEIRTTAFIFILVGLLGVANIVVNSDLVKSRIKSTFISPAGNESSIFKYFINKKPTKSKVVYGFLPYWMINQANFLKMDSLTDIAYFGLNIQKDGTFRKINSNGETDPGYNNWKNNKSLDELIKKSKENGVRFALTIISHNDDISTEFLNCSSCWATLKNELFSELESKGITDVHLNFEYVGYVEDEKNKTRFTEFTAYLNKELDQKYGESFLVVSSFADAVKNNRITNIQDITKVSDGVFIMGYDFHRPSSDTAGPVAPINGIGKYSDYDLQTMVKDYISVAPPNKLILGVPYYGYNWVVEKDEPYAKRVKNVNEQESERFDYEQSPEVYTNEHSVSQTYDTITETIKELGIKVNWDDTAKVPYYSYISPESGALREVYFDNVESLQAKFNLAKQNSFMGVGIWALGYDGDRPELWDLLRFYIK